MAALGPPCAAGRCGQAAAASCRWVGAGWQRCAAAGVRDRQLQKRPQLYCHVPLRLGFGGACGRVAACMHAIGRCSTTCRRRRLLPAAACRRHYSTPSPSHPGSLQVVSKHSAVPEAQGLFNPENDKDACGVGFVAGELARAAAARRLAAAGAGWARLCPPCFKLSPRWISHAPPPALPPATELSKEPKRQTVVEALEMLRRMTHRGACGCETNTGGCGGWGLGPAVLLAECTHACDANVQGTKPVLPLEQSPVLAPTVCWCSPLHYQP